jgi:hypothetical protein
MAVEHAPDIAVAGGIVAEVVVLLLLPCLGDNRRHVEIVDAVVVVDMVENALDCPFRDLIRSLYLFPV